jgi:hypothetical protein
VRSFTILVEIAIESKSKAEPGRLVIALANLAARASCVRASRPPPHRHRHGGHKATL